MDSEKFIEELKHCFDLTGGVRSISIDLDKGVLEINGKPVKRKTVVKLPAQDGFYYQRLFNFDENDPQAEYDRIKVDVVIAT